MLPALYQHQAHELRQLLLCSTTHRLLAWQMGAGKTAVAVRYGATLPGAKLYCCPASTKLQTAREIQRFGAPGTRVQILDGGRAKLDPDVDWYVINYELLLCDDVFRQLLVRHWSLLALDECHLLRSPTAQRTRRVLGRAPCLAGQADHVLALTGTPIVNSPLDLFPLVNRLFPYALAVEDANGQPRRMQLAEYEERYCIHRAVKLGGGRTVRSIAGGKNLDDLRERLTPYVSYLRRADVLDLPPLMLHDYALTVDAGDALAAATAALPRDLAEALQRADDEALPALLQRHAGALATLRRLIGTLKAAAAAEHILARLEGGEDRIVGFFHHRDVGDIILQQLHAANVAAAAIHGSTPSTARAKAVDALTAGGLRVLLLQNQSGSLGLNLQSCRRAVIVEPDWTDATTQQAIGRVYRAGQRRNVVVEFLVLTDTLDERVVGVAKRKAAIAADLFPSTKAA